MRLRIRRALVRSLLDPQTGASGAEFPEFICARHPGGDTVLIWMSHLIADGFATSQCASLLAMIYSRLAAKPDYQPERNIAPRDSQQWMADLTFRDMLRMIRRDVVDALQARGPGAWVETVRLRNVPRYSSGGDGGLCQTPHPSPCRHRYRPRRRDAWLHTQRPTVRCLYPGFRRFPGRGPRRRRGEFGLTVDLRSYAPVRHRHATYSHGQSPMSRSDPTSVRPSTIPWLW